MAETSCDVAPLPAGPSAAGPSPALTVEGLGVRHADGTRALDGVDLELAPGEVLGLVGESGSGKTTVALSLLGLVDGEVTGTAALGGRRIDLADRRQAASWRWTGISLAFQHAQAGLNPVHRVIDQIAEPIVVHRGAKRPEARAQAAALWDEVGLPASRHGAYPHQLSGGEARRAMLAMALACAPRVLIADEPTAGLDAVRRRQLIDLLQRLRINGTALLLISHDLADLDALADRVLVLHGGRVVESGPARRVLDDPRHPYTWRLVDSYPRLDRTRDLATARAEAEPATATPGANATTTSPPGCGYAPHCQQAIVECHRIRPALEWVDGAQVACLRGGLRVMLRAAGLNAGYLGVPILSGVDLEIRAGETLAIVGPSGSGKTTLARCLAGLLDPIAGDIWSEDAAQGPAAGVASGVQLVAQDPVDALNPRFTVQRLVGEPLTIARTDPEVTRQRVLVALTAVGLPTAPAFLSRRPEQLSGGQLQRVAIARALVSEPRVLVADEPTAMLDSVEQARLLRVLRDRQDATGLALIFITHNLPLVRKIAHRTIVVDHGGIVEAGSTHRLVTNPRHPTTRALLDAPTTNQEDL